MKTMLPVLKKSFFYSDDTNTIYHLKDDVVFV